jgi:hypothetical protein
VIMILLQGTQATFIQMLLYIDNDGLILNVLGRIGNVAGFFLRSHGKGRCASDQSFKIDPFSKGI